MSGKFLTTRELIDRIADKYPGYPCTDEKDLAERFRDVLDDFDYFTESPEKYDRSAIKEIVRWSEEGGK